MEVIRHMYLTVHNQLTLLHDLLDEQAIYRTVSLNEYKQIRRLVQAICTNNDIDEELLSILPEIYNYGIKGELSQSQLEHIVTNETNIKKWLHTIHRAKMKIS